MKGFKTKRLRKLASCLTALALAAASLLATAEPAMAASNVVLEDGIYVLYSYNKETGMNCQFAKLKDVVIDEMNGETHELWVLTNVGDGYVNIRPLHNTRYFLSGEKGKGEGLVLKTGYSSNTSFQWKPIQISEHEFVFQCRRTGMVIDCTNGNIGQAGARYITWERNGYKEAQSLFPVRISAFTGTQTPGSRASLSEGVYQFLFHNDRSKAANIQFAALLGGQVVSDPANQQLNEQIRVVDRGNNLYSFHPLHAPDLCLAPADIFPDSRVVLKRFDANDRSCTWEVYKVGSSNAYAFRNAQSLLFMDDYCCRARNTGNPVITFSYNGCNAQWFYPQKVSGSTTVAASGSSWDYPMVNTYVCGNEWSERYAPKAAEGRPDHCGIDIASRTGSTAVYAAADGEVVDKGYNSANGNYVVLKHTLSGKTVYSFYAHLKSYKNISGTISKGTQIGTMGTSGSSSTGDHVHFAIANKFVSRGGYVGYTYTFSNSANQVVHNGITFYNPHYVVKNDKLP